MKKHRNIKAFGLVLATAAALGLGVVTAAHAADDSEMQAILSRMAEMERTQEALQQEIRQLRERLEAARSEPAAAAGAAAADGGEAAAADGGRVAEVERKQGVITEEVRRIRDALALPESKELKSEYGLGPAASKVYGRTSGVSIGSYGEFNYNNIVSDSGGAGDEFDMLRLVLYTGYKFNDWLVFNSEVEFEHGTTGEDGEVAVEFATLDVLLDEKANLRGGLVLMPMGFLNEIHEPPFFHGTVRPQVEQRILPSTWNAGGVGLFGELLPGLTYRTYAVTGLDASGFSSAGIRGGRQEGSLEKAENFAWVGRLDYSPVEALTIGGSAYIGNSGQNQAFGNPVDGYTKPDVFTQIYEVHGQLRTHGLEARALGAWVELDDAAVLSRDGEINPHVTDPAKTDQPVAGSQFGWYGEIAYNVLPLLLDTDHYLAPWFRYSHFDTQDDVAAGFLSDDSRDRDIFEVGLTYKPITNVVFKLDYRNQDSEGGDLPDEVRFGAGFAY